MGVLFCKFDHEVSLQASGGRVRMFGRNQGTVDFNFDRVVVSGAVNICEGVVHLMTTNGVYEVRSDPVTGHLCVEKIGNELP